MASTCVVGVSGWLCLARLNVDPAVPKPGGRWQLPREEPKKERSRVKYSFGCPSQIPAASSNVFSNAQHKSPSLGSFCFALRVNLLVWARDRSPAPCLSFPIWAEGLVWVCFCSGVQWRQVQSSTLKSSDEKRWRRTEAY